MRLEVKIGFEGNFGLKQTPRKCFKLYEQTRRTSLQVRLGEGVQVLTCQNLHASCQTYVITSSGSIELFLIHLSEVTRSGN